VSGPDKEEPKYETVVGQTAALGRCRALSHKGHRKLSRQPLQSALPICPANTKTLALSPLAILQYAGPPWNLTHFYRPLPKSARANNRLYKLFNLFAVTYRVSLYTSVAGWKIEAFQCPWVPTSPPFRSAPPFQLLNNRRPLKLHHNSTWDSQYAT
jgi:hypothetical protein